MKPNILMSLLFYLSSFCCHCENKRGGLRVLHQQTNKLHEPVMSD